MNIIKHARKSLQIHDGNAWVKKEGNPLFDITMVRYDGAEVFERVALYLLSKRTSLVSTKSLRLYMDSGLAVIHRANGQKWTGQGKTLLHCPYLRNFPLPLTKLVRNRLPRCLIEPKDGHFFPYRKRNNILFSF